MAYCNWRSQQEGRNPFYNIQNELVTLVDGATGYRLPTEAEWEYAAREGGKKVRFGNGQDVIKPLEINFDATKESKKSYSVVGRYRQKTVRVSALSANSLGLYQMSGNTFEWCWDWYSADYYAKSNGIHNPLGPTEGVYHVLRGGDYYCSPQRCRAAYRTSESKLTVWELFFGPRAVGIRLALPFTGR